MHSTTKPIAKALAYRWGELQEEPPNFIDNLMIDLTRELVAARESGETERAQCLDDIIRMLAEGIVKYEHSARRPLKGEALEQAVVELRTYYYLETGLPRNGQESPDEGSGRPKRPAGARARPDAPALG